jgi:adenylate cyclase
MRARAKRLNTAASRQEVLSIYERALAIELRSADAKIGIASVLVSNIADGWSSFVGEDVKG